MSLREELVEARKAARRWTVDAKAHEKAVNFKQIRAARASIVSLSTLDAKP